MKYLLVAGIAIVIGFIIVLSFIPLGIEPLTEAYFENHTKLPVNIFLFKNYNFSFSVHNLEYQNMSYFYNITTDYDNKTFVIDSGNFSLEDNETKTIAGNFSINKHFERTEIKIEIYKLNNVISFKNKLWWPDPNYAKEIDLHFWVDEIVPVKITITPD